MNIGLLFYRYRSYTPLPLLAVGVILGHPTIDSIGGGLFLCIIGEAIRFWGVHTAGPLTRMTAGPGGNDLVTHGPYAFIRNPLYLGNIIIYTGIGLMTNIWWMPVFGWMYFKIQYDFIISEEERYLIGHFGERYATYMKHVRRFFPRFTAYRDGLSEQFKVSTAETLHSERRTFQAIAIALIIMTALAYLKN